MSKKNKINIKNCYRQSYFLDDDSFTKLLCTYKQFHKKRLSPQHIRNLVRKILKFRKMLTGAKRKEYTKAELWSLNNRLKMNENEILSGLFPKRTRNWKAPTKRRFVDGRLDLKDFSFIDNPLTTLNYFTELAEAETKYALRSYKLNFIDETISDISPYLLLGTIKSDMFPFISGGYMSQHLKQIMRPLKLDEYLRINLHNDETDPHIIALPVLTNNKDTGEFRTDKFEARDMASTAICNQFNAWLTKLCEGKSIKLCLSPTGTQNLTGIIGEVLENAEKHAYPEKGINYGKWNVTCFMEYQQDKDMYRCCLSFFNKGKSIAETIQATTDEAIKKQLNEYVIKHKKLDKDLLATVFAVQDSITREKKIASQGGLGMMSMVHFIQQIGKNTDINKTPNIVIISGNTYIKFAGDYMATNYDDFGKRYQWFNNNNTKDEEPDENFVFKLKNRILGTIITARFYLDKGMIRDD